MDYLAGHANPNVQYHASDMIMNIHSDASYLSEEKARSRTCRHFFPGVGTKTWQAHSVKRWVLREHGDPTICRRIRGGGRVRCTVSQLPNIYYFSTHTDRYRPPKTKHARTLRQRYHSRHCEQHHKMSTLKIYGNEVLMGGE